MKTGILVVNGKTVQVKFLSKKGKETIGQIPATELSAPLTQLKQEKIEQLNGLEVEFEPLAGQPKKIRKKGEDWQASGVQPRQQQRGNKNQSHQQQRGNTNQPQNNAHGDFHNPYNFVPALSRKTVQGPLGDGTPAGHGRLLEDHWTGKITIEIQTKTPLLIPDAARLKKDNEEHKTYPLRQVGDKPYLPSTSVKGMLRSAYEMVTNSRLSVFAGHEEKLAYRMNTTLGQQMVPVRIAKNQEGMLEIHICKGTSTLGEHGAPSHEVYAAWLPTYPQERRVTSPNREQPQHGQAVSAWVQEVEHFRWSRRGYQYSFTYWQVLKIAQSNQSLGPQPQAGEDPDPPQDRGRNTYHKRLARVIKIDGYVCKTGKNALNKHDERIFFNEGDAIAPLPLSDHLQKQWKNLITNYQEIHKDELSEPKPSIFKSHQNGEWSRHIRTPNGQKAVAERQLKDGSLCFAQVSLQGSKVTILGLYPVTLSRDLYPCAPQDLIQESMNLTPAQSMDELSPVDRVFGWVKQAGKGAYKGQIRICAIEQPEPEAIRTFKTPLPLTILGEPKPQQSRFYVALNDQGQPLHNRTPKEEGYQQGQGIRGRKIYPHHSGLPGAYWEPQNTDYQGREREYLSPKGTTSNQNKSIEAWVEPDQVFKFELNVLNLSPVELGALLWILSLPEEHFHRVGGGKPLGFGSVRIKIAQSDLRSGKQWADYYQQLIQLPSQPEQNSILDNCIKQFQKQVEEQYGQKFKAVTFIDAFLSATKGFREPIHYPREQPQQNINGEGFKWFTANEKGEQLSLPALSNERGLPYNP